MKAATRRVWWGMTLCALIASSAHAAEFNDLPRVFLLNAKHLHSVRQQIQSGSTNFAPALADLQRQARGAVSVGPFSVTSKSIVPPSGDKRDYMSQAPYWWPNPNSTNGLPYIRRDGETNPEIGRLSDRGNIDRLTSAVNTLALAYYFLNDEAYASAAARLLRAWFLDPTTGMHPNLQFGQGIPGITQGRGIGLIETRGLAGLVDSVGLLHGSQSWTEADHQGLQKWFSDYLRWMLESGHGKDEAAARNNHGTYYDVQVASFALFVGSNTLARTVLENAASKRIAAQVRSDGSQPEEIARTRSWSYSIMNLQGLLSLATLGENVGVNLWEFQTADGRGIRRAIDFMIPFATGKESWPHRQIGGSAGGGLHGIVRTAAVKYPDGNYRSVLAALPAPTRRSGRSGLLEPPLSGADESAAAGPAVFMLHGPAMRATRDRLAGGNASSEESAALARLRADAKDAMLRGPYSVTNKSIIPPGGTLNDYMSMAPYFWPNPNTSNGLPYIRRDGERNPEIFQIPNRLHLGELCDTVETLALAFYFASDESAAERATLLLRTWFINPDSRMNPHLEFGQFIKGVNTGRGIGIIETRALIRVVDAIGLLADSIAWTSREQRGMEQWYDAYLTWMLESKHGRDEAAAKNNHGTYYDAQVASFALFLGRTNVARNVLAEAGPKRIAVQVDPDGTQPLELDRTRAWSYSVGNLAGLMSLARLGEHVGVDLWNYKSADGRSIRKALDYLAPFGLGEKPWEFQQIDGWSAELFYPVLRLAAVKYPDGPYRAMANRIPRLPESSRGHLFLSPLEPVNRLHLPTQNHSP